MKAIQIHAHGGPDVLKYEDVTLSAPGRGELRIRIKAIGLNFIDVYYRTGLYPAPSFPYIPGDEAAGEVIGIGEKVRGFKIGDRVAYVSNFGSYAEERNISAEEVVKLPDGVKYETAAAMMLKDLMLAQQAANAAGASTPLGAEAAQLFSLFVNSGNGAKDFSGIIKMLDGK